MTFFRNARWLGTAALAAVLATPASAQTHAAKSAPGLRAATAVTNVDYSEGYAWRHRHGVRHRSRIVSVDAPFARVETRRWYSTAVDAPFASVRVHRRHGVWVRAPFVNLYVPR